MTLSWNRARGLGLGLCAAMMMLAGCTTVKVNAPPPTTPLLVEARLVGGRICGNFSNVWGSFSFACPALPTATPSGWQLNPMLLPGPLDPNPYVSNRTVNLTITTPSLTEIEIARLPNATNRIILEQVGEAVRDAQVGALPMSANGTGRVAVASSDDLTVKTWHIRFFVNICDDRVVLEIVNKSSDGSQRSAPLSLTILRPAGESLCVDTGGGGGLAYSSGVAPGQMSNVPLGTCPGGATPRLFRVCESVIGAPQSQSQYSETIACSFAEVQRAMGFFRDPPNQMTIKEQTGWRLNEVSNVRACRGP